MSKFWFRVGQIGCLALGTTYLVMGDWPRGILGVGASFLMTILREDITK